MKKYKVSEKETDISDEAIESHMDFGKLSHRYERMTKRPQPLYKNPRILLILVLIAVVAWLVAQEFDKDQSDQDNHSKEEQGFLNN